MKNIKSFINNILVITRTRHFFTSIILLKILLIDYGHAKSSSSWKSIDQSGNPIPWFTYPFIDYLKKQNLKPLSVFEYGSGYSTHFWSTHAKFVYSVEHSQEWAKKTFLLLKNVPKSKYKLFIENSKKSYVNKISFSNQRKYDIVVVDGEYRKECAKIAIKYISKKGVIILDNSDWYPGICAMLKANKFKQISFRGFTPINHYISETSLFIKNASWLN